MSAKAFADVMAAAGFGYEAAAAASAAQSKASGVQASFEARLAEQRRQFETMQAVQAELKADEEKLAATVGRLRRKMDDSTRALSAAESKRERLKQELARATTECVEHSKAKEQCTALLHEATAQAAAVREEKLRRACGGSAAAASAASTSAAAAAVASGASAEPNLFGEGWLAETGAAGGGGGGTDDLLGLEAEAFPSHSTAQPDLWGHDLLGGGSRGAAPPNSDAFGGAAPSDDAFGGFSGFECGSGGGGSGAQAHDSFGLEVRGSSCADADPFWGSSPLGGKASPPPPAANPPRSAMTQQGMQKRGGTGGARPGAPSADPFADLSSLGNSMPRR
jgi:uncharacterized coiled-coil protein SlyX